MATPPSLSEFRALYPEFDAPVATDAQVLAYLQPNIDEFSASVWGTGRCYKRGVYLLTAHELALSIARRASAAGNGGVASVPGVLQSGHEEGIAFAFQRTTYSSATGEWLALSPYGMEFGVLSRACVNRSTLSW